MTHNYLLDLEVLSHERCVIFYDQIGNGLSTPIGKEAAAFVSLSFQCDELENLLQYLGVASEYVLFAHSAGGCVAIEHALSKPSGLRGLILANAFPSAALMQAGLGTWREELEADLRSALTGQTKNPAMEDHTRELALEQFFRRHVCRVPPPDHLLHSLTMTSRFPEVQQKMLGPDLFAWEGELADWSARDRLHEIAVPTLAFGGKWDESHPDCLQEIQRLLPDCQAITFEKSSHLPHIEEREACLLAISQYLGKLQA